MNSFEEHSIRIEYMKMYLQSHPYSTANDAFEFAESILTGEMSAKIPFSKMSNPKVETKKVDHMKIQYCD